MYHTIGRKEAERRFREVHGDKYTYDWNTFTSWKRHKMTIYCPEHGKFEQMPHNHAQGQGCPKCGLINAHSHQGVQQFLKSSKERFGNKYSFPYIDTEYKSSHSKITIKCNDCGNVFTKIACDHITSPIGGCKTCWLESNKKYLTYEQCQAFTTVQLKPFEGTVLEKDHTHLVAICPKHGEYETTLGTVKKGNGQCKRCYSGTGNLIPVEEFVRRMKERYGDTIKYDVSEYVNMTTPMTFECTRCGYKYRSTGTQLVNYIKHTGCYRCTNKMLGQERTKTTEDFIAQSKAVHGENAYDYSLTKYVSSKDKVTLICKDCGNKFEVEANSHLQGQGCPRHHRNKSIQEEELVAFLKSLKIEVIENDRSILDGYELDILLPKYNIAIEYDGLYWHSDVSKDKNYHLNKTNKCLAKGVRLIHVFEDEWMKRREAVKSRLKNILGFTTDKVFARKCEIREVETKECNDFLETNHLQGKCGSSIKYGLYCNDELVSVMTFGKTRHFIGGSNFEYELLRFANKCDVSVIGGASKLLKHFIKNHHPKSIVSYADKRWSNGHLYETLGFVKYNESKPNYFYVLFDKRFNRFNFRKSVLVKQGYDSNKSEREIMLERNIHRIYDCGCLCYKMEFE